MFNPANRLTEDDDFTYIYDNNGNLSQKIEKGTSATTSYTYDAENQLIRIDLPNGDIAQYKYDGLGRRIEKDINGALTRYVYDNEDILYEFDGSNNVLARYVHGLGIDEPLIMQRGGSDFYYHADGLGSITDITDNTGTVAKAYVYDSFGNIVDETGAVENPYTYTARERDQESGLYFYRRRYYDPSLGRFLSRDPISILGGINLYTYTLNNPINFVDPFGLRGTFRENFSFSFRASNDFFFGGPTRFIRTGVGALTAK